MIDGTYAVAAKTPLGARNGTIVLVSDGAACEADLTIDGKTKHLTGTVENGQITFKGSIKLPFPIGKQDFTIAGTIEGDTLVGACKTKRFHFDINGQRVA